MFTSWEIHWQYKSEILSFEMYNVYIYVVKTIKNNNQKIISQMTKDVQIFSEQPQFYEHLIRVSDLNGLKINKEKEQ